MTRWLILSSQPHQLTLETAGLQVLTPNPRAARAFRVKFCSLEHVARRIVSHHGLTVATEIVRHHALREAIQETARPADIAGYTRYVAATVQEILRAGYPYHDPSPDLSERARGLLELTVHYRDVLRRQLLVDPAEVLWAATELEVDPLPLLVAGYPRLGKGEAAFLAAVAGEGSVVVLPTRAHPSFRLNLMVVEALRRAGWQIEPCDPMHEVDGEVSTSNFLGDHAPSARALRFATEETEVRFVLTCVKQLLHAGQSPDTIALIARDDALYGPLVHDIAWEYEVPVKASYARPLRDTPFGAWLELLITVLKEGFPFEETAKLLSHPLCARLPREVWARLRVQRPMGRSAWLEQLPDLACLAWPEHASLAEYSDCLRLVLDRLGAAERAAASARDLMALRKVQRALESLVAVTPEAPAA